ncbi:hypothetical protein CROQUDRAFT_655833 [Cronartium quercuum f. sp. fusiforme G11]|uniref:AMP-activated protein kinase glycogen-binding domain-containing protein n=1 Tax=Cronartium quercuum f. sp. fusiforme G11 TaxID=708437 RepID=A0A9P6NQC5_9BASI|nr:hypothetical protein CROQUDRAFT_655833 [Cronartium quercuum f. sp. fusiforme G11]
MAILDQPEDLTSQKQKSTYTHQFRWDSSVPQQVFIKGSFDQWQSPLELFKEQSGKFGRSIELEYGSRVLYKYVVDGNWRHNPNEPTETDLHGNINNLLEVPPYVSPSPSPEPSNEEEEEDLPADSEPVAPQTTSPSPDEPVQSQSSGSLPGSLPNTAVSPTPFPHPPSPSSSSSRSARTPVRSNHLLKQRAQSTISPPKTRHRHTSLHSSLLLGPTKSSPAQASVSTVVSAMAGVAATAIPAAIYAVTGKDLIAGSSKITVVEQQKSTVTKSTEFGVPELQSDAVTKEQKSNAIDEGQNLDTLVEETSDTIVGQEQQDVLLNDPKKNTEGETANTHISLPPSELKSIPQKLKPIPEPNEQTVGQEQAEVLLTDPKKNAESQPVNTHLALPPAEPELVTQKLEPIPKPTKHEPTPQPNKEVGVEPIAEEVVTQPIAEPATQSSTEPTANHPQSEVATYPLPPLQQQPEVSSTPETHQTNTKGRYGNLSLSPNKCSSNSPKNGGWRASVGSFGRRPSGVEDRAVSEASPAIVPMETPERKRKTSLFHKIKVALSPGHRKSPSTDQH